MRRIKLIIPLFVILLTAFLPAKAQHRTDSEGNTVYHPFFAVAQYQMGNFDYAKESGYYGLGLLCTSFSHWGRVHVGANLDFSLNAGFVDDWGCLIDFGPSARIDITNHVFVNVPVDVACAVVSVDGSTDSATSWGMRIVPSIHAFITDRVGLFAGPQLNFGFSSGSKAAFGMQAGVSYAF